MGLSYYLSTYSRADSVKIGAALPARPHPRELGSTARLVFVPIDKQPTRGISSAVTLQCRDYYHIATRDFFRDREPEAWDSTVASVSGGVYLPS